MVKYHGYFALRSALLIKRIFTALVLTAVLILNLSGCGNSDNAENSYTLIEESTSVSLENTEENEAEKKNVEADSKSTSEASSADNEDSSISEKTEETEENDPVISEETEKTLLGMQEIDGKKHCVYTDGSYYSGWFTINGETYYMSPETYEPVTGYQFIEDTGYLFSDEGILYLTLNETDDHIIQTYCNDDITLQLFCYCKLLIFDNYGYTLSGAYNWCIDNMVYEWNDPIDWTGVSDPPYERYYVHSDEGMCNAWVDWDAAVSEVLLAAQGYTMSQWYAYDTFNWYDGTQYHGDCRAYAAVFYWCAKFLGYDACYMFGVLDCRTQTVIGSYDGYYGDHAWVEIDGLIFDPQAGDDTGSDFYGISYESDPWGRGVNRDFGPQE